MSFFKTIRQSVKYKRNNSSAKEKRRRLADMETAQEDNTKRLTFKSMLVDMIEKLLPQDEDTSLLIRIDEHYGELLDDAVNDPDIRALFNIEQDPDDKFLVLFSWAFIDL